MTLYICWGLFQTFGSHGHPCRNAYDALRAAGHDPEVVRSYGWGLLPSWMNRSRGRRRVRELTGGDWVPLLVLDDGGVVRGSQTIIEWAENSGSPE